MSRTAIAVWWGVLMGALSLAPAAFTVLSDHRALAVMQIAVAVLLFPGLVAGALMGSMVPAAGINWLCHFGICYFVLGFFPPFRKSRQSEDI